MPQHPSPPPSTVPLPAPTAQSLSALLHLSPCNGGLVAVSGFGECILSRLVGRSVCLRQLQITLSDSIVLRLGDLQCSPPKQQQQQWLHLTLDRQRGRLFRRGRQTAADGHRLGLCDSKLQRRRCSLNPFSSLRGRRGSLEGEAGGRSDASSSRHALQ